jgi:hypothetical protein
VLNYTGTLSNTGNITLVNVNVTNSQSRGSGPILGPITLAPGETITYVASYIVPLDFCGTDTVMASGYGSCTDAQVTSSVTTTCPVTTSPRIAVTQSCPTQPTLRGGIHTFTGTVSNTGDVYLTNVFVFSSQSVSVLTWQPDAAGRVVALKGLSGPNSQCLLQAVQAAWYDCQGPNLSSASTSLAGNNTPVLGPIQLAPGESKKFSGSYTVTAGSDPLTDFVTASGTDTCRARTVNAAANCSGVSAVVSTNPDIILQSADGNLAAWYMDGLNATSTLRLNPPSSGDSKWRVAGTLYLNRDGKTDRLFQHSGDGTIAVWFMDGINLTEGRLLNPSKPGGTWRVVAPK